VSLLSRKFILAYKFDWVLVVLVFILTAIGLSAIYSVDLSRGADLIYFPTQTIALALGLIIMFSASFLHISMYQSAAKWGYIVSLILLVGVLIFGQTVRGTTGWFRFAGFSFQPAEFAKIAFVLFLSQWIYRYNRRFDSWQFVVSSGLIMLSIVGLIMMQPDLGSALMIGGIWFASLILTGTKKRYIAAIVGTGLLAVIIGWFFLFAPYQKDRLMTFFQPERDPLGSGYNVRQSMIAIGSGRFLGRGLGFGSQSQLHFLPEAHTDFVFAVVGEELGFIGAGLVLGLYFVLLWRLFWIASTARDDFSAYTVLGVASFFFIQMCVNIGATLGLLPVTGLTLPFVSYGGSSLIINFAMIGIVESVVLSGRR
jgi:rod shape determining protein RodA